MSRINNLRTDLVDFVHRQMAGPIVWNDDYYSFEQTLQESPLNAFSIGVLYPQKAKVIELEDSQLSLDSDDDVNDIKKKTTSELLLKEAPGNLGEGDVGGDDPLTLASSYNPSSMGISFSLGENIDSVELCVNVRASKYLAESIEGKKHYKKYIRKPLSIAEEKFSVGNQTKIFDRRYLKADDDSRIDLYLSVLARNRPDGTLLITVSLVNDRKHNSENARPGYDECYFQTGLSVSVAEETEVVPYQKHHKEFSLAKGVTEYQHEEESLELLYRNRRSYAIGHGCSPEWGGQEDGRISWIRTALIPTVELPPVLPRENREFDGLKMSFLGGWANSDRESIIEALMTLPSEYQESLTGWQQGMSEIDEHLKDAATRNLEKVEACLERIKSGIRFLENDPEGFKAFQYMNQTMLMQQYHNGRAVRRVDEELISIPSLDNPIEYESEVLRKGRGSWRSFQLAFILMCLPSLADESHDERDLIDLIWFPTGGGKTEAYLGLSAFTIMYRRLKKLDQTENCVVLMRYTLRLLTTQQFQRAAALITSCELLRRRQPDELGHFPISLGLWVGGASSPNKRKDACDALEKWKRQSYAKNPFQILSCPICGTELDNRRKPGYRKDKISGKSTIQFKCIEESCPCNKKNGNYYIPVTVIDEDIYEHSPSFIVGTVDKFALLAWKNETRGMFGLGREGGLPPSLIIQDELHLISGPLGSMVGLYESAISLLCCRDNRVPKIVASTATIRGAVEQCRNLYNRRVFQFPPPALDISDNYFAIEDKTKVGRLYAGIFATSSPSAITTMVRLYASLMQGIKMIDLKDEQEEDARDPYWTMVGYFNSLRELGIAQTLFLADIPEYIPSIIRREGYDPSDRKVFNKAIRRIYRPEELTSRLQAEEIPKILEALEHTYPSESKAKRPVDVVLATNMISVGVDIDRLGLMVVNGQPKTTSEYIQASSRVGRSHIAPGIVFAALNPGKSRDRSHYEHFKEYHESFYKMVEPTSVTPFSSPVIDRAIHALVVILARQILDLSKPDELFKGLKSNELGIWLDKVKQRCASINPEHLNYFNSSIESFLGSWENTNPAIWGYFGYKDPDKPLLYPSGTRPREIWNDEAFPTPSSLRNVDAECEVQIISDYSAD